MEMIKLFLDAAKLCFPSIQDPLGSTVSVSWGAVLFVAMTAIALAWVARKRHRATVTELKRELERAKATLAGANPPQRPEPKWKTECERFPERGVLYAVRYPLDEQGDLANRILVSEPRCLRHQTPMTQRWRQSPWRCDGCGLQISNEENAKLQTIAKSNVLKQIHPEAVAA